MAAHRRGILLMSSALMGAAMLGAPASAQVTSEAGNPVEKSIKFDIPAESLSQALTDFSQVSSKQIIYSEGLVKGRAVQGLHGSFTPSQALSALLSGTDLQYETNNAGVLMVRSKNVRAALNEGAAASPPTAQTVAQQTSSADQPLVDNPNASAAPEEIVVTGISASLKNARATKMESAGIVDAIATEDIGKLPDTNLAESLQRITGVSIDRSGGEGAFVTVRGFGPEFNTVLINGRQIATPTDPSQASGRAFSFDTLASELVSGVDVYKSSTANLQSGGVGATVNIKTARPFDYQGLKGSASVSGDYDFNSGKEAPNGSFLVSDNFGGKFGALASFTYQERHDRLNNASTDGWLVNPGVPTSVINGGAGVAKTPTNPQGNIFIPQDFNTLVTFEDRQRIGGTLVFQYAPTDDVVVTLDGLYSQFTDSTDARSFGHWFTASSLDSLTTDANGTAIDMTQSSGLGDDFHAKKFDKKTKTGDLGLNVDWQINDRLDANFDGSYSRALEDPNGGDESYLTLLGYNQATGSYPAPYTTYVNNTGNILPYTTWFNAPGGVAGGTHPLYDHVMLLRGYGVDDKVGQLKANFTYQGGNPDSGLTKLQFGLYFSHDDKDTALYSNDGGSGCTTCGYNIAAPASVPISVFDAGSGFLSGISGSNNLITKWLTFNGDQLFQAITAQQRATNPNFTFAAPMVNNTDVVEQVQGGYVQADFGGKFLDRPIKAVLGTRVETTFSSISGLSTAFQQLAKIPTDPTQYQVFSSGNTTVGQHNHYTDILPNFSLRYDVTDELVTRLAASETITRPTLEDLSPVTTLVTLRPGDFAASSGNADLKPFKSNNLDLSFEYYFGKTNYVSLGAFYKDVSNFIVLNQKTGTVANAAGAALIDPGTGQPAQFTITAPVNGQEAAVKGIEAAYQQALWDTGVGFQVNGTFAETDHNLDAQNLSDKFAVTGLSSSANAVLYYDKGPYEARLAYNWRDKFLQYLAPPPLNGAGQAVTQVRPRYQLDFGSTYHVTDKIGVFFNAVNITNTPLLKYAYYGNQFLSAEDSGIRLNFGVRASF